MSITKELDLGTDYLLKVAKTIGGDITPTEILDLVMRAHEDGFLFHGVKRDYAAVAIEGILPLTPHLEISAK